MPNAGLIDGEFSGYLVQNYLVWKTAMNGWWHTTNSANAESRHIIANPPNNPNQAIDLLGAFVTLAHRLPCVGGDDDFINFVIQSLFADHRIIANLLNNPAISKSASP